MSTVWAGGICIDWDPNNEANRVMHATLCHLCHKPKWLSIPYWIPCDRWSTKDDDIFAIKIELIDMNSSFDTTK